MVDESNFNKGAQKIPNINIEGIKKQRFTVNNDPNTVLELDTSDVNIITRLKEVYPKLNELATEATQKVDINDDASIEDQLNSMADVLQEIDIKMRNYIDYIFDSNVSEICAPKGSMYAPCNGKFRFEIITETLGSLYKTRIDNEARKLSLRMKNHTDKYTSKRKK